MRRWTVRDRFGNEVYLTQERWEHIVQAFSHPEMLAYEGRLKETIQSGQRKQDRLRASNRMSPTYVIARSAATKQSQPPEWEIASLRSQ